MRRDWNLIRRIMLGAEKAGILYAPEEPVREHVRLLFEAGLLEGVDVSTGVGLPMINVRPTWRGWEFVDMIRDDEVWAQVLARIHDVELESVPFAILEELLRDEIKRRQNRSHPYVSVSIIRPSPTPPAANDAP